MISEAADDAVPVVSSSAVWARGLVRKFGKDTAVDHLDLDIAPGEFYGLLGQNGAGKTTTIKMIVGLLRPTAGTAGIGEVDTWKHPIEVKRRIGVLPEEFNLYERLTGAELLDFAAGMHGLERAETIDRPVAWLSLHAAIDDQRWFVMHLAAAVGTPTAIPCDQPTVTVREREIHGHTPALVPRLSLY